MTIDTSGKWWKGEDFADLEEYIRRYTETGYPTQQIVQSVCTCGNAQFRLRADTDEGCAQRICTLCAHTFFICDSAEYWPDAKPKTIRCPCKNDIFDVGVGFSFRDDGEVRWITVGERCIACGVLGSCAEWKIDYSPSHHLLALI